jgi:hypothetical protein
MVNNLGSRTGRQEPELHGGIRIGVPERCRPYCPLGCGSFLPMPLYLDDGSFPPMHFLKS